MASTWNPLSSVEDHFNHTIAINFMANIWPYSLSISAFYIITIFGLQHFMQNRPKFDLRGPLMMWSLLLFGFSFYGFCVAGVYHWSYAYNYGWKRSVCDDVIIEKQVGLWSYLFCFSKGPELLDTYFIVLRKKKLIFLHWYHHITVFIYCWYSYGHLTNPQQWFITMNYFVHALMYLYYAVRASSYFRPPMWVNIVITSLQLIQMVVGVWVNVYLFYNMKYDPNWTCDGKSEDRFYYIYFALALYGSYFVLFAQFFYTSYICKNSVKVSPEVAGRVETISNGGLVNGLSTTSHHMKKRK